MWRVLTQNKLKYKNILYKFGSTFSKGGFVKVDYIYFL